MTKKQTPATQNIEELENEVANLQKQNNALKGRVGELEQAKTRLEREGKSFLRKLLKQYKLYADELQGMNTQLTSSNEALEAFAYRASHELKSPAVSILSMLGLIRSRVDLSDDILAKSIENVELLVSSQLEVVTDLLELTRVTKKTNDVVEWVCFESVMEEVQETLQVDTDLANYKIVCDFSKVDKVKFARINLLSIMLNIATNSIKYRSPDRNGVLKISSGIENGKVFLKAQDNGLGIDLVEHKDKVFKMFKRFHSHTSGTGVGLYIIKQILVNNGGSVELESEVDRGTKISIYFA